MKQDILNFWTCVCLAKKLEDHCLFFFLFLELLNNFYYLLEFQVTMALDLMLCN
jgi:hypothetical protein